VCHDNWALYLSCVAAIEVGEGLSPRVRAHLEKRGRKTTRWATHEGLGQSQMTADDVCCMRELLQPIWTRANHTSGGADA
jgi:hypothetical protein